MKCTLGQLRRLIRESLQNEAMGTTTMLPPMDDESSYEENEEKLLPLKKIDAGLKAAMNTLVDRVKKMNDDFLKRYEAAGISEEEMMAKRKKSEELLTQLRAMDSVGSSNRNVEISNKETISPRGKNK